MFEASPSPSFNQDANTEAFKSLRVATRRRGRDVAQEEERGDKRKRRNRGGGGETSPVADNANEVQQFPSSPMKAHVFNASDPFESQARDAEKLMWPVVKVQT